MSRSLPSWRKRKWRFLLLAWYLQVDVVGKVWPWSKEYKRMVMWQSVSSKYIHMIPYAHLCFPSHTMTPIPSCFFAPNFGVFFFRFECISPSISINLHKGNLLQFWEGKTEVIDAKHAFYGVGMSIRHAQLVLKVALWNSRENWWKESTKWIKNYDTLLGNKVWICLNPSSCIQSTTRRFQKVTCCSKIQFKDVKWVETLLSLHD